MTWSRHTTFDGEIGGDAHCAFARNVASSDPDGTPRAIDAPRYGYPFGFGSVVDSTDNVYDPASGSSTICIGSGIGADGVWFSVWYEEGGTNSGRLIAIRESDLAVKTSAAFDIGTYADMTQGAHDYNRFVPRASTTVNILPGGLWLLPCRRDYDTSEGSNTFYAWGVSLLVRQGVTYDNIFDAPMTVHDDDNWYDQAGDLQAGFVEGLIDSTTSNPHPNTKVREWSSAVTPVSAASTAPEDFTDFWFTWTDYAEASYIEATSVHTTPKPGGSVYLVHCTRPVGGPTWTIGSVREIVSEEDPGPTAEFYNDTDTALYQHYHSAIAVAHSTGELDVIAFIGDLTHRSWTRRFRVVTPGSYTTSTINEQRDQEGASEAFGSPAIGSPQLICPQIGQNANEIFVATDIRHEALLKVTVPVDLTAPLQAEAVIDRGIGVAGIIDVSMAYVLHIMVSRPWERKGYYLNCSAYLNDYTDWPTTLMYSETGEPGTWIEFAEYQNRQAIAAGGYGVYMWPYSIDTTTGLRYALKPTGTLRQPLLIEPGGAQRFAATNARTQVHTDNTGSVTVTSLTQDGSGNWLDTDESTPLDPQPPLSPLVCKVVSTMTITDTGKHQSIAQLSVSDKGTNTTFELGDLCSRVYILVDPAAPRGHALLAGSGYRASPMGGASRGKCQPTSTKTWIPHINYVPTDRVSTYEYAYRLDSRSDDVESPVLAGNVGSAGVVTLPVSFYVAFSSLLQATSGELLPAYGMAAGVTGNDESLIFTLPTVTTAYACALNLTIPRGCPDSMYAKSGDGTNDSRSGETVYWSWYADANNKVELALDRANKVFKLYVYNGGALQETISVADVWLIAEGTWAVRISQGADRKWRIAIRHSGNRVTGSEGSYSCSWVPTNHRPGTQAGDVANLGVFEVLDRGISWSPSLSELETLAYQTDLTQSGAPGMGLSQLDTEITSASPLRYFRFNETTGDLLDYGSGDQDLTVLATPTRNVAGPLSNQLAYTFNGTDQICRNTNAYTLSDGDASFYCIFKTAASSPPSAQEYLFETGGATLRFIAVFDATTGKMSLSWVNSTRTYNRKTQVGLYDGLWHRLAVHMHNEVGNDSYTATLDGEAITLDSSSAVGSDSGTYIAGRASSLRFAGSIAKIAFWNSDASASFDALEAAYSVTGLPGTYTGVRGSRRYHGRVRKGDGF